MSLELYYIESQYCVTNSDTGPYKTLEQEKLPRPAAPSSGRILNIKSKPKIEIISNIHLHTILSQKFLDQLNWKPIQVDPLKPRPALPPRNYRIQDSLLSYLRRRLEHSIHTLILDDINVIDFNGSDAIDLWRRNSFIGPIGRGESEDYIARVGSSYAVAAY
jgi:hypothetical protein